MRPREAQRAKGRENPGKSHGQRYLRLASGREIESLDFGKHWPDNPGLGGSGVGALALGLWRWGSGLGAMV